ncbi:MAG: hypothetical protein K0S35_2992, partial [Geminicoccaceae bacterium]|nr:hypothetical protein [Geminicoccaceae bacterium]
LRDAEIEAVADYVLSSLQGKAEPTLADCLTFWGEDSRECASMR